MPLNPPDGRPLFPLDAPAEPALPQSGPVFEAMLRLWAARGGEREFPVVGDSMHPILEDIQRIRARMGDRRVRFGEIVLFYRDGRLIAHRALLRGRSGYRTRGDGSRGFDPDRLPRDQILGVVTHLLWKEHAVELRGPGSGLLCRLQGGLSLLAGWMRIDPEGPREGGTLGGRVRDRLLGPAYRGALRHGFGVYAGTSLVLRRVGRILRQRPARDLVALLRVGEPPPQRLLEGVQWRELTRRAIRLGMGPMVMSRLRSIGALERIPTGARRDLERTYYAHALYNTKVLSELAEILSGFTARGIEPIVLKGAAHAGRLYPNIALRVLSDLDLLLRPDELEPAKAELKKRGYRPDTRSFPEEFYRGHHHLPPYVPPRGHPRVEIHTDLVSPNVGLPLDLDGFRGRAVPVTFQEAEARVLCPSDQIVHAAVHLALSDKFVRGVKDLVDLDRLARGLDDEGWELLLRTVAAPRLGRAVYYCLDLARRFLGTPVPSGVWSRLRRQRLPLTEDVTLRRVSRTYVTTWPESDEFFGLTRAQRLVTALLEESAGGARRGRILRGIFGGGAGDRPKPPA